MASGLTIRKELVVNGLISDITIDWFASQLCILPSGQDELRIVQKTTDRFPASKLFYVEEKGQELLIADGRKRFLNIGFNMSRTTLEVYLPEKRLNSIIIKLTGGELSVAGLHAESCKCRITSGRANVSGELGELDLHITGSKVIGTSLNARQMCIRSTSSTAELNGKYQSIESRFTGGRAAINSLSVPEQIHSVSTSARITVSIPENDGFNIHVKKTPGGIKSEFPLVSNGNHLTYAGGKREYTVKVWGGQFQLNRKGLR